MKSLVNLLKKKKMTIAFAESCTGGLLSKSITDIPGASEVLNMSVTVYSNEAKQKLLGVSADTLQQYGAVSPQTAIEMALGILQLSNADIAISTTGIAGPGGGSDEKPVGRVYIGIATNEGVFSKKCTFTGNRTQVRNQTKALAFEMAKALLKD